MNEHPVSIEPIVLPMPALLGTVNAYLIHGPEGVALIDCGLHDAASRKDFAAALEVRGLAFEDIDTVFLTHHHVDHAGAALFFQAHGAKILMAKADADLLHDFYRHPELDETRALFSGKHGLPDEFRDSLRSVFSFLRGLGRDFTPDRWIADNETVILGGLPFQVTASPGHTPGHLCLWSKERKIAFTGDCVISPRATYISVNPGPPTADPYLDFIASLERLSTLTGITPLSGHGAHQKPLHIAAPKIIAHLNSELTALSTRLSDSPMSAFSLSRVVSTERPRAFPQWLAVSQTIAYLTHLTLTGKARTIETNEGVAYRAT